MEIDKIRQDFPILRDGKTIYFDNACQSLRPESVIAAIDEYYEKYPACGGRSVHKLAEIVTKRVDEARSEIAKFIGANRKEEIIFTKNTTEGINLVANSLDLKKGDIVLITDKEHNSNLIPWQILSEKKGIILKIVHSKDDNTFDLEKFESAMTDNVKLVSFVFTSNLDGTTIPAEEIIKIAHEHGALVMLDAAQTMAHQKVDVEKLEVDFLAFSGHKMLGPSGTGVLYGKYKLLEKLEPFMVGGETVQFSTYEDHKLLPPPEKFEAGLQDYAGIIGLAEAAKYIESVGFESIQKQEKELNQYISKEISEISGLKIIGPAEAERRGSIVNFYHEKAEPHQIALVLSEAGIMVRSGQHCVHSWFNAKGIKGSVRASVAFYNTLEEARVFCEKLKEIIKLY